MFFKIIIKIILLALKLIKIYSAQQFNDTLMFIILFCLNYWIFFKKINFLNYWIFYKKSNNLGNV